MKTKHSVPMLAAAALLVLSAGCGKPAETPQPAEAPAAAPVAAPAEAPAAAPAAAPAQAAVPDAVPAKLTEHPALASWAFDVSFKYASSGVFTSPVFNDQEKAAARKVLPLVVEAYDKAIALYAGAPHYYFGRAKALATMYSDTKDPKMKERALADVEKTLALNPAFPGAPELKASLSK